MLNDLLTDRARKAVADARSEATRLRHEYVGTEHLLLGLLMEDGGVACRVLGDLGRASAEVRSAVEKLMRPGTATEPKEPLPLTPRAKKAFERAAAEAHDMGHNYVSTEHLLLGLLHESDGVAGRVLTRMGVTHDAVRDDVLKVLNFHAGVRKAEPAVKKKPTAAHGGTYELKAEIEFAAAHHLRGYQGECENLHGHNWKVEVVFVGARLNDLGMLLDFREAKAHLNAVVEQFDHTDLNQHPRFRDMNPTTENLARLICDELQPRLPTGVRVQSVTVWESARCGVTYSPPPPAAARPARGGRPKRK